MSKHKPGQFWVMLGTSGYEHYSKTVRGLWFNLFDNCELYATFCVRGDLLLPHAVARMVEFLEQETGKQFVFKAGRVYKFTRIE